MISANWTRENIAWAAGLFEGEGCVGVYSKPDGARGPRKAPVMKISMTDLDVLEKFQRIVGFGKIHGPTIRRQPNHKPVWSWSCGGTEKVQALLAAFWSYLCARRQAKAQEVIVAMASIPPRPSAARNFCRRGHRYSEETTYRYGNKRRCAICDTERSLKWHEDNAEHAKALARARYQARRHGH